jgi:ABC-type Fe3+ transport system permease subunit
LARPDKRESMASRLGAAAPLLRIYDDAREDSLVAAYSAAIVAPLSALAAHWLLRRGAQTTPTQVLLGALVVPGLCIGVPVVCILQHFPCPW